VFATAGSGLTPTDPSRLFLNEAIAMVCAIVFSYVLWVFVEGPTYRLRWLPLARRQRTAIAL
jgi:hypothetical protein